MNTRFDRQVILPGFGKESQKKLNHASVLVVGAGGLGCPALMYLSAAGFGKIGVIDGDKVDESNLNRQILFGFDDIGKNKADTAVYKLNTQFHDIDFVSYPNYINQQNALDIILRYDIVVDGSDNFPTRYLVNDACVLLKKPLVLGAIYQHEGQVSVFDNHQNNLQYRDLYPNIPTLGEIPNCNENGVLGVLPGIIGTMQAAETIKLVTNYGKSLVGKVLYYNLKTNSFYETEISENSNKFFPKNITEFLEYNYNHTCEPLGIEEIEWNEAIELLENNNQTQVWDIRESNETPLFYHNKLKKIPLSRFNEVQEIDPDTNQIFICCQSGVRSLLFAKKLKKLFPQIETYSIAGGINEIPKQMLNPNQTIKS